MNVTSFNRLCALAALAAFAFGCQAARAESNEVYGGVGTDGVSVGVGHAFNSYTALRGEVGGFALSHKFSSDGLDYNAHVRLIHGGVFADVFPFPTHVPLHLTVGALIGGDQVTGEAQPRADGTYKINGVVVPGFGQTISAKLKWPTVRPYIGFGFGHSPTGKAGLSVAADIGVAYGTPHVSFDVPAVVATAAGANNVAAAEQQLRDKAHDLRFYPVVKVVMTDRF
ncbi:hypothetical protein [Burkholderia sp. Ac-20379]|uniref:hypothetical protein n=1 Tax=Burkholderia sp. Ac-20379 TaxID=2703900 RepID=UPI00197EF3BC|nr:hypothetical protein [Burkholderia sp. Ac-20379]MBN3727525.1 hypothetical protein [Burkholderia sp. Ac-20379]